MRIVICEDEQHHIIVLERLIRKWAGKRAKEITLDTYTNPEELWKDYQRGQTYELAFFDIQMPEMSGLELARHVHRVDMGMLVVFVTNFFDYVINAIEADAFRFLHKPVKEHDCMAALDAAVERLNLRSSVAFVMQTEDGTQRVHKSDIVYFESQRHYIECHTIKGMYRFRGSLTVLEKEFCEPHFVKCHRSYLVNVSHVYCILQTEVILTNDQKLPVSRKKYNKLNECFLSVHVDGESPGNHIIVNDT